MKPPKVIKRHNSIHYHSTDFISWVMKKAEQHNVMVSLIVWSLIGVALFGVIFWILYNIKIEH